VLPAAAALQPLLAGDNNDSSSSYHNKGAENGCSGFVLWVVAFECSRGVHLPFHLLTTAQAILTAARLPSSSSIPSTTISNQSVPGALLRSAFARIELIYYTEADQVTVARSKQSLRNLAAVARPRHSGEAQRNAEGATTATDTASQTKSSLFHRSEVSKDQVRHSSVLIAPQRMVMRFPESAFTALEELSDYRHSKNSASSESIGDETSKVSKAGPCLTEAVEIVAQSLSSSVDLKMAQPRLANALALTNACASCPVALCPPYQIDIAVATHGTNVDGDKDTKHGGSEARQPVLIDSASSIYSTYSSVAEARRHWLLSHGFDYRDTRTWPSQKPTPAPTLVPLPIPTMMPTQVPSPLPSYAPTPHPSRPPGPQHPLVHISRALGVLAVCLAAAAKIRMLRSDQNFRAPEYQKYSVKSAVKRLPVSHGYETNEAHRTWERTPNTGSTVRDGTIEASSPTDLNYDSFKKEDKACDYNSKFEKRFRATTSSGSSGSCGTRVLTQAGGHARERKLLRVAAAKILMRSANNYEACDDNNPIVEGNNDHFTSV